MFDAVNESEWAHTSAILAQLHNVNRDPNSRAVGPDDYNPLKLRPRGKRKFDIEALKMRIPQYAAAMAVKARARAAAKSTPTAPETLIGGGREPARPGQYL